MTFKKLKLYQLEFGRAIIDIVLGASAFVYVMQNGQEERSVSLDQEQLKQIFHLTPINLQLAWDETIGYLSKFGPHTKEINITFATSVLRTLYIFR